jgi:hypothetical protein
MVDKCNNSRLPLPIPRDALRGIVCYASERWGVKIAGWADRRWVLRRSAGGEGALWLGAERHDRTRQLVCEACKERTSRALQEAWRERERWWRRRRSECTRPGKATTGRLAWGSIPGKLAGSVSLASATASALIRPAIHHHAGMDLRRQREPLMTMCDDAISDVLRFQTLVSSQGQQPINSVLLSRAEALCTTLALFLSTVLVRLGGVRQRPLARIRLL